MRFRFGRNWLSYASKLSEQDLEVAKGSLRDLLGWEDLTGRTFLDVGCGSGIVSVAAAELGATVRSFDFDPDSVRSTQQLSSNRGHSFKVERGDILDPDFVEALGTFDVVYSWGVLHHTGSMWRACEAVTSLVGPEGQLVVALYNDQGWQSTVWGWIKRAYNALPFLRPVLVGLSFLAIWGAKSAMSVVRFQSPLKAWRAYGERGMSPWHDLIDWVGGYPFEVATPAETVTFFEQRGFRTLDVRSVAPRLGCNEFVFRRTA